MHPLWAWFSKRRQTFKEFERQDREFEERIRKITKTWEAFCKELDQRTEEIERWQSGFLDVTTHIGEGQAEIVALLQDLRIRVLDIEVKLEAMKNGGN